MHHDIVATKKDEALRSSSLRTVANLWPFCCNLVTLAV
jgi:hypothetical protein